MANIRTPHAAVVIWNYDERFGSSPATDPNEVDRVVVSTISLTSIKTTKAKNNPQGSFEFSLAPTKNWVSLLTPGSWCTILMSNHALTKADFTKADPKKVKMVGKIESVRVDVSVDGDGTRKTNYVVTGTDWGYIFNNIIYIDNNIAGENEPLTQGNGVAIAIRRILFGERGTPNSYSVKDNLLSLIKLFGNGLRGLSEQGDEINRLANAVYDFAMPKDMVNFFQFVNPNGIGTSDKINESMTLYTGRLTGYDSYSNDDVAEGFLDPFSLQGQHTFWQILIENSNPALNEMFCELKWDTAGPRLALYNRMKPFSVNKNAGLSSDDFKSYFNDIKCNVIEKEDILGVNAGTNWRDKFNFVEIKPTFQAFDTFAPWYKRESQQFDKEAFQREGFRPLILPTKQFPKGTINAAKVDWKQMANWSNAVKDWYFDTHKMLNGTINIIGQSNYIGVGENIMFSSEVIAATPNINKAQMDLKKSVNILAHVESVSHSFSVNGDGSRQYLTTIQFVRGILVNESRAVVGNGMLDAKASVFNSGEPANSKNIVATSTKQDPNLGAE